MSTTALVVRVPRAVAAHQGHCSAMARNEGPQNQLLETARENPNSPLGRGGLLMVGVHTQVGGGMQTRCLMTAFRGQNGKGEIAQEILHLPEAGRRVLVISVPVLSMAARALSGCSSLSFHSPGRKTLLYSRVKKSKGTGWQSGHGPALTPQSLFLTPAVFTCSYKKQTKAKTMKCYF